MEEIALGYQGQEPELLGIGPQIRGEVGVNLVILPGLHAGEPESVEAIWVIGHQFNVF